MVGTGSHACAYFFPISPRFPWVAKALAGLWTQQQQRVYYPPPGLLRFPRSLTVSNQNIPKHQQFIMHPNPAEQKDSLYWICMQQVWPFTLPIRTTMRRPISQYLILTTHNCSPKSNDKVHCAMNLPFHVQRFENLHTIAPYSNKTSPQSHQLNQNSQLLAQSGQMKQWFCSRKNQHDNNDINEHKNTIF